MGKVLLFCFNLKKSAAESHQMLVEAYGDMLYRKQRTEIGFAGSQRFCPKDGKNV